MMNRTGSIRLVLDVIADDLALLCRLHDREADAALIEELRKDNLPGVVFRPVHFEPTFHKFAGQLCGGVQIHVTDRDAFKPVITGVAIISAIRRLYPGDFAWKQPPYEYVYDKLPFDVISGSSGLREQIEAAAPVADIEESWREDLNDFANQRSMYLLYD